jgi:hypothetical protein
MRKNILLLTVLCLSFFLTNCKKEDNSIKDPAQVSYVPKIEANRLKSSMAIRGINWADPNGNEGPSRVVTPSGLTSSMTATQAASVATSISTAVKASGGTAVRMPINYWTTTNTTYWPVYKAAINAIVSNGCYVILCWWPNSGHSVSDVTQWNYMWDQVNSAYKSNTKVLYEPINEPVDYTGANLCNLYAGFLSRYTPSSWKCILDGTGYAGEVITVGNDSRLSSQYLGLHCYWWFWGAYSNWSGAYNKMSSLVGSYASRTIVTEIGVETLRTINFWWQWDTGIEPDAAFLTGSLAYAKDNQIGTIAWSGVNDIDTYRWYMAYNNLIEVNPGCANMFRWSWGQAEKWIGPIKNGTYRLQNRANSLYLDNMGVTTDGSNVCQYASGTSNNQKWVVTYTAGYYVLSCVTGGKCLDTGGNTADGSNVQQWVRGSSYNQHWTLVATSSGYYKLVNRSTGKCLDTGGQTANGAPMKQYYSNTSNNQQWRFVQ